MLGYTLQLQKFFLLLLICLFAEVGCAGPGCGTRVKHFIVFTGSSKEKKMKWPAPAQFDLL